MKKILSFFLIFALMLSVVGCTSTETEGEDTTSQILKVAAFAGGYGEDLWKSLVEEFEKQNPGVTVELTTASNLDEILRPQIQAGNYPDVIQYNIGQASGFAETLIKEDALLDISDVFSDPAVSSRIAEGFADNSITQPYGDGRTYLAPLFYSPCGLWFNKTLFQEGGYPLPETWEDMWALGEMAKEDGVDLFTYPVKGYFDSVLYAMLYQAGGADYYADALRYGENTWTSEEGDLVLDTISKLVTEYTMKETSANANSGNFMMNQQAVLDGKTLFMPNGNWIIGEMGEAPRVDGFEWGFMPLPAFTEGGDRYAYTFFEQMYIPAAAENADLGKEFIKFMYSEEAVNIMLNNTKKDADGNVVEAIVVQPVKGIVNQLDGNNKLIYSIYEAENTYPALGSFAATDAIEGLELKPVVFGPIDSLLEGTMTKEQWKQDLVDAFARFRTALK